MPSSNAQPQNFRTEGKPPPKPATARLDLALELAQLAAEAARLAAWAGERCPRAEPGVGLVLREAEATAREMRKALARLAAEVEAVTIHFVRPPDDRQKKTKGVEK